MSAFSRCARALILGYSCLSHCCTSDSSCSSARCSGFWQVIPSTRQKPTNRDRAQRNIESIFDKFCYHFARPEGKRKLKLQWVVLCHGVVNPFQLLAVEFRRAPKQGFGLQRTPTSPSILGQPTVHRRTLTP